MQQMFNFYALYLQKKEKCWTRLLPLFVSLRLLHVYSLTPILQYYLTDMYLLKN